MNSESGQGDKLSSLPSAQSCHHFSLLEIKSATKDFDNELVIGQGGFGKVFKGQISGEEGDIFVAIKRLDSTSSQGELEFRAEIEMLSKLRHCHLVSLIGYCDDIDNKEMILVYEYMPHGTLYHHIHKAELGLNWEQRMRIAIGAARGLDYLHTGVGTKHGVIHRDVKSSNILLDANWEAKISDFGLSKIGPTNQSSSYVDASVKGTFGYLDPEYFYTRKLTRKTDIYAFGVVMFELLSGRFAVDDRNGEENCSLVRWAKKCVKDRKLDQMVDCNIKGTISPKCLRGFVQIADRCVSNLLRERPSMTEVLASLQALLELQKKYDNNPSESYGIMVFASKMNKYLRLSTKVKSDHVGTSNSSRHEETVLCTTQIQSEDIKKFTYDELKCAAKGFGYETCFGEWRYGKLYKGWVDEMTYSPSNTDIGLAVAIKIFEYPLGGLQFDLLLRRLSHPNVVKLIGYCQDGGVLFLVYEFMHNGSLEDCLHNGAIARLPLDKRVEVALEIARALVFLYKTRDQTTSELSWLQEACVYTRCNILLNEDFTAKFWEYNVWDFTSCYDEKIDSYYHPGCPHPKSLYGRRNLTSFTVVLAEILNGEPIPHRTSYVNNSYQGSDRHFGVLNDWKRLGSLARFCLKMCDDVDCKIKVLNALDELYHSPGKTLTTSMLENISLN